MGGPTMVEGEQQIREEIEELKTQLRNLQEQRDALEVEATTIKTALTSPGPNGAKPAGLRGTPLVDSQGFPRADIDVHDATIKRNRLACIDTDHLNLMKEIESLLHELHSKSKLLPKPPKDQTRKNTEQQRTSQPRNNHNNSSSNSSSLSSSNIITSENLSVGRSEIDKEESKFNNNSNESLAGHTNAKYIEKGTVAFELYSSLTPFLLVDLVFPNSPASSAGLLVNDKVVKFGHIEDNMINSRDRALPTVGQFVQGNQGVPITVIVRREMKAEENRNTSSSSTRESENYQLVELILTPQTWEGRGLLGCHIINV